MTGRQMCGVALFSLALLGCRDAKPTVGGTEGWLHSGHVKLSEIQVTVYQMEGGTPKQLGFGIPDAEGVFRLMTNDAQGPLQLLPGEYRCTLESIGAPVAIPKEYADANTTPLKILWSATDRKFDLDIPGLKPIR